MQKTGDPQFEHYKTVLAGGKVEFGPEEKEYTGKRHPRAKAEDEEG